MRGEHDKKGRTLIATRLRDNAPARALVDVQAPEADSVSGRQGHPTLPLSPEEAPDGLLRRLPITFPVCPQHYCRVGNASRLSQSHRPANLAHLTNGPGNGRVARAALASNNSAAGPQRSDGASLEGASLYASQPPRRIVPPTRDRSRSARCGQAPVPLTPGAALHTPGGRSLLTTIRMRGNPGTHSNSARGTRLRLLGSWACIFGARRTPETDSILQWVTTLSPRSPASLPAAYLIRRPERTLLCTPALTALERHGKAVRNMNDCSTIGLPPLTLEDTHWRVCGAGLTKKHPRHGPVALIPQPPCEGESSHGSQNTSGQVSPYRTERIRREPEPARLSFREEQCLAHNDIPVQADVPRQGDRILPCPQIQGGRRHTMQPRLHLSCVQGQCVKAGCDRVIGSSRRFDKCGVCGGDGSTCKKESGSLDRARPGYQDVVTIPAGATHLDVKQRAPGNGRHDNSYLAVRRLDGTYLLNGDYKLMTMETDIALRGSLLHYSGSSTTLERLRSFAPLPEPLVIQVLSVGEAPRPRVKYSYFAPRPNNAASGSNNNAGRRHSINAIREVGGAEWSLREWGACSQTCGGGTQQREVVCLDSQGRTSRDCPEELRPLASRPAPPSSAPPGSSESGPCAPRPVAEASANASCAASATTGARSPTTAVTPRAGRDPCWSCAIREPVKDCFINLTSRRPPSLERTIRSSPPPLPLKI
ncbi:unnamed protein product [Pleuronectes platessa]|uniref:Uncharacterized protein n=1 Tax=Pleuronectes platessa TaxID=8262 RepID=A0A9N7TQW3_PLEPL|nr:unnamed protein product [Pleuronectes platessa]